MCVTEDQVNRLKKALNERLEDLATSPNWGITIPEFYEWQQTNRLFHIKTVRMVVDCFAATCQSCFIFGDKYDAMFLHFFGETVEENSARWDPNWSKKLDEDHRP